MTKLDTPHGTKPSSLTVIEGGRRQREEELLKEFLHPGIGNLQRIRSLADRLKHRTTLTVHKRDGSNPDRGELTG